MTDKELLELATLAMQRAGYVEFNNFEVLDNNTVILYTGSSRSVESVYWMPLHDDGHAFRLGNALQIDILHNWESVTAQWAIGKFCREKCTDETRDKATRRAIVRAVANQEWLMSRCINNETQV